VDDFFCNGSCFFDIPDRDLKKIIGITIAIENCSRINQTLIYFSQSNLA